MGLYQTRRLLNTEKLIFMADGDQLSENGGGLYVLVSVEPAGFVTFPNVQERQDVIYNIALETFGNIWPDKQFSDRLRSINGNPFAKSSGISPNSELSEKSKTPRCFMFPMDEGISPSKELECIIKHEDLEHFSLLRCQVTANMKGRSAEEVAERILSRPSLSGLQVIVEKKHSYICLSSSD
ncbi:hypothetical protein Syun_025097 [Stephania yunnanensis]|uniref:Uncharacterized protein n=1 Tax=Stephania yunnanensis TaxID=152371 RepID=A0AAP0HUK4_9MAGN